MDKPWFKSITVLGGTAWAGIQLGELIGLVPPGTGATLGQIGAGLAGLYGLRRSFGLNKPIYQSVTMWGGSALALVQGLEAAGKIPTGVGEQVATIATGLATIATAYGLRRAVPAAG